MAPTSSQKVFNIKPGCAKELRQTKVDTISLATRSSFASFIASSPTSGLTSGFHLNFKFRSADKFGPIAQIPLLMSGGFLFLDFNVNTVGLSLIVDGEIIWNGDVDCAATKSIYDEWNQVQLALEKNR